MRCLCSSHMMQQLVASSSCAPGHSITSPGKNIAHMHRTWPVWQETCKKMKLSYGNMFKALSGTEKHHICDVVSCIKYDLKYKNGTLYLKWLIGQKMHKSDKFHSLWKVYRQLEAHGWLLVASATDGKWEEKRCSTVVILKARLCSHSCLMLHFQVPIVQHHTNICDFRKWSSSS